MYFCSMNKESLIRIILLFAGLVVAHLGVSFFLLADLGSDPFNVMIQGLSRTLGNLLGWKVISHGNTHVAVSFLIIIVLLFVDRSYIRIGTLICMFCGGPIIDFFNMFLGGLVSAESHLLIRVLFNALGCVILACGMSVVIKSEAGTGPNDLVGVVISDKLHRKFSVVRMVVDACFLVCGWLLGGPVGLGTVICLFLVGPVAGICLPRSEKLVAGILKSAGLRG